MTKKRITDNERVKNYKLINPFALQHRVDLYKNDEVKNQFEVLEQLGFIILKFPSEDKKLSGFSLKKGNKKCIYINSNTSKGRQHFSLWHEYYHLITGDGIGVCYDDGFKYSESECRAQLFASIFLMPENKVRQYFTENNITMPYLKNVEMLKMANDFKVSCSALLYRLIDLYPNKTLNNRFGTVNNYSKLVEMAGNNCSLEYEEITNDCYISPKFFEHLQKNYLDGKLSDNRMEFINNLLEKVQENCDE